tara:strand:+ start:178 stop:648 length:471 start_codon:yes stop_codon:yes gene_type:complete
MKFISHRGNTKGINKSKENSKQYVQEAISKGFDVEVDLWGQNDNLFLGHENAKFKVDFDWLIQRKENLWIHCKNFNSMYLLLNSDLRFFFHEKEDYNLVSDKHIWAHNFSEINNSCIIPLLTKDEALNWKFQNVYGVCSDFVEILRDRFNKENFKY